MPKVEPGEWRIAEEIRTGEAAMTYMVRARAPEYPNQWLYKVKTAAPIEPIP